MTSRPALATKHRRPLSAIFLGSNPAAQFLPDLPLPDPQSAASSPGSSGLPSPPASNSTGSGSNGGGDLSSSTCADRPPSLMNNGRGGPRRSTSISLSRSPSRSPSDDGDDGNEEDHTARLSGGPSGARSDSRSMENTTESALQRVRSLTQRNRLVLNKLASISSGSRLSTASPTTVSRRSPAPSTGNSTTSSSQVARRRSSSISRASGSETERDTSNNAASDSEGHSETPTSATGSHFRTASLSVHRTSGRLETKKASPEHPSREGSVEPRDETRSRFRPESRAEDVEAAALAAVAQSRRESPVEARRRQPLPREFLSGEGQPPQTPRRERTTSGSYSVNDSPSSSRATLHDSPMSPRTRTTRYSTIRELARRNQTRWLSQDLSPLKNASDEGTPSPSRRANGDSPRRNFVGESLRSAGLVRLKEEGDDVFGEAGRRLRISSEVGARPSSSRLESSSRPGTRFSERPVTSDAERYMEPRTPANPMYVSQRTVQTAKAERPTTSTAAYCEDPHTAPPAVRSYRPSYVLPDGDRARQTGDLPSRSSSQARNYVISSSTIGERSSSSSGIRRSTSSPLNIASAAAGEPAPEHTRLMLESLGMFESQLSRLPSLGTTTTVTIPELFRSAQNIVHAADGLSNMLRRGTAYALEQQIDAEVGEDGRPVDLVSLWRDVGADFRESVRVSDELVRTMTTFLLGVGKVLRESTSEGMHNRTVSLEDGALRRNTPEIPPSADGSRRSESTRLSSEGNRSSLDGKSRWIASSGEMGRTTTSFTSLNSANSATSLRPSSNSRALADAGLGGGPSESISESEIVSRKLARLSLSNPRHMDSFHDLREPKTRFALGLNADDDLEGPVDSPSAAVIARHQGTLPRRSNTVAVPPPLETLPSESLLSRRSTERAGTFSRRPKTTNSTARAATSIFPTLSSTGEPTTAINTAQASPERPRHAPIASMSRTFSRAAGAAALGLQQSMERDVRKRTVSANSAVSSEARQTRTGSEIERVESRPRASLDSNNGGGSVAIRGAARDRRGTVTSLFSRN